MLLNLISKKTLSVAMVTLFISSTLTIASANPGKHRPPEEAFTACADLSEGDACSFTGNDESVEGSCKAPRRGNGPLACAPAGGPPTR